MKIITKLLDALRLDSAEESESDLKISSQNTMPDAQTIYFKNGKMYDVYPTDETSWYDAKYLISDGIFYDLEDKKSLASIPVPSFKENNLFEGYGITGSLEYVLKMKAANLRNKGKIEESDCIYKRLHLFMSASDNGYQEKDYLNYSRILLREGRFEEFEVEEKRIKEYLKTVKTCGETFDFYNIKEQLMHKTLSDCKRFGTDYIMMSAHCDCCEECNKLQGRVYSISGKSKIFSKLPDKIRKTGQVHEGCRHHFSAYFFHNDGEDTVFNKMGEHVDAIKASQRPFVDDRSEEEKQNYLDFLKRQENEKVKKEDEIVYYHLVKELPDIAPKSFSAYRRMKNPRSKNFLKLVEAAKEHGINIDLD